MHDAGQRKSTVHFEALEEYFCPICWLNDIYSGENCLFRPFFCYVKAIFICLTKCSSARKTYENKVEVCDFQVFLVFFHESLFQWSKFGNETAVKVGSATWHSNVLTSLHGMPPWVDCLHDIEVAQRRLTRGHIVTLKKINRCIPTPAQASEVSYRLWGSRQSLMVLRFSRLTHSVCSVLIFLPLTFHAKLTFCLLSTRKALASLSTRRLQEST